MKILYVEDEIAHVVLAERVLEENLHGEFKLIHAETIAEALHVIDTDSEVALILSDLHLRDGTGLDLLKRVRERKSAPAVVLITAPGDQEAAVIGLQAGAADYLVKQTDYLQRLPIVISNAIAQNRYLREQEALYQAEIKYQSLVEQISAVVFLDQADGDQTTLYMSPRIEELTGYTVEEWNADPDLWIKSIHPEDRARVADHDKKTTENGSRFLEEYRFIRRDGRIIWIKEDTSLIRDVDGHPLYWQGILLDVTKEKEDEASIQRQLQELTVLHSTSLAASNALQIDKLIEDITSIIGKMLDPDNFGILLFDWATNTLKPHASYRGTSPQNLSRPFPVTQGITGKVVSSGKPLRVLDVTKEPEYIEVSDGIQSELCVPIIARNQVMGVINTESKKQNAYSERDERLLTTIAHTVATATDKLRSFDEARQRATELEALYQASRSLALSLEPEIIARNLIGTMDEMLGHELAVVHLIEEKTQLLIPLAVSPKAQVTENYEKGKESPANKKIQLGAGVIGWVAQHGQPIRTGDITKEKRYSQMFNDIHSELCVPLITRGRVIGTLNIESTEPNAYTDRDENLLTALANSAAVAFENAQLYQHALQSAERRTILHKISQDIVRFSQDPEQIYTAIHDTAGKLMSCDVFVIILRDEEKDENIFVYGVEAKNRLAPQSVTASKGLTGTVINQGESLILRDNAEIEQRAVLHFGSPRHVQSVVAVPMRISDRILGMISAQSYEAYAYGIEEQALLEMLATHAATAIENNRLFESERKRRQEAETLRQAASVISSTLDPDDVVKEILIALQQVIPYDNASVFFHEENQLRVAMAHGSPHADELRNLTFPAKEELFEQIQKTGRPITLQDAQQDPRFKKWGETSKIHGWMAIPLVTRNHVIGYITLDSYQPGTYNDAIIETAMAFANQAAAGIENARLFEEQNQRSKIIEALADIANYVATTRDVRSALDQIAQRALELLNANHVAIYLLQEDNVTLKTITAHGIYRKELLSHTRRIGEGITGNVFLNGKPEIVNNTREDPRRVIIPGTLEKETKLDSLMSSPLILHGKPIGIINAWRTKENGLFNKTELNFLVGIAHQASICIESGRLFHETNRQAQEAAALAEVGRDISAILQLDIVLERIASYALKLLNSETSAVYLTEATTSTLHAIAALGTDAEEIKNDPLSIGAGILGNIALQDVGEIVNDTVNDPRAITIKGTGDDPLEHIMGVPLLMKDQHTGLLAVWRSGTNTEYSTRELNFLTSLARQAAVAIENARLYNETQRRVKELEIINSISTSLRTTQSLEEMLPILLNETLQLMYTEHGSIWLYDHTSDQLIQRVASGSETKIKHKSLGPMDGIIGATFRTGKLHAADELKSNLMLFEGNRDSMPPGLSAICIPIQSTAGPVGVLAVVLERKQQTAEEINLLAILAEITGNAIHRAQLYDQSQKQVRRLTSLRDIDSAIASSFDLRLTLNILMDQTRSHLNVDAVTIGLYHPDLQALTYLSGVGFNIPSPTRPQTRISESLAGQVIVQQQAVHITNLQRAPEAANELLVKREGFVTYIGIPLIVKGQIKGVFEVYHRSPLSPTPDWMDFLHTLAGQAAIAIDSSQLFENLQRSNQELLQAYDTTLEGWARALELRDRETEGHTRRVTELTLHLARYMGVSDSEIVNIYRGVLLHDIGKMGVPDHILKKKGKLTPEEWVEMRQHPTYAYNLLSPISFLRGVLDIPYCHHEHWDGSGYPRGLKAEQIPLAARIFSVVDIWDALLSDRPYRKAWPLERVKEYIKESAGTILDPRIVNIFLTMIDEEEKQTG